MRVGGWAGESGTREKEHVLEKNVQSKCEWERERQGRQGIRSCNRLALLRKRRKHTHTCTHLHTHTLAHTCTLLHTHTRAHAFTRGVHAHVRSALVGRSASPRKIFLLKKVESIKSIFLLKLMDQTVRCRTSWRASNPASAQQDLADGRTPLVKIQIKMMNLIRNIPPGCKRLIYRKRFFKYRQQDPSTTIAFDEARIFFCSNPTTWNATKPTGTIKKKLSKDFVLSVISDNDDVKAFVNSSHSYYFARTSLKFKGNVGGCYRFLPSFLLWAETSWSRKLSWFVIFERNCWNLLQNKLIRHLRASLANIKLPKIFCHKQFFGRKRNRSWNDWSAADINFQTIWQQKVFLIIAGGFKLLLLVPVNGVWPFLKSLGKTLLSFVWMKSS